MPARQAASSSIPAPVGAPATTDTLVQLHFGRFVHPVYREQLHAVPPGFRYVWRHPALDDATTPTKRVLEENAVLTTARQLSERAALRALSRAGYVHRVHAESMPGAALIHSGERLLWRSPLPYVLDFEHVELFVLYQRIALDRPWARRSLWQALTDERLRSLLPWSDAARRSVLHALGPRAEAALGPRMEVVYPAIRAAVDGPRSGVGAGPLRLLFVGTSFYEKGGVEAIRAVQRLSATHDVHLDLLSYVPDEWRALVAGDTAITLHAPGGHDVVQRLYRQADAMLFPSHMDTFGYVVLEAMAHALPVVAPRHLALTELVAEDESGLLFEAENTLYGEDTACRFPSTLPPPRRFREALRAPSDAYVDGVAAALARLAEDRALRERLSAGALEQVRSGIFSVQRRQGALRRIYASAL